MRQLLQALATLQVPVTTMALFVVVLSVVEAKMSSLIVIVPSAEDTL